MKEQYDVAILGGGLAGLTLAMQLKKNQPKISIVVLEMRKNACPDSAHKVGESTVELGTYYLREVLGLSDYLDKNQLPKQGLRFYFSPQVKTEIDKRVELGPKDSLPIPSHQIDRGTFENDLISMLSDLGIDICLGARIKDIEFNKEGHYLYYTNQGISKDLRSNWIVDATGRAAFVKRKLGFEKTLDHNINAIWFRVKGEIDVDNWSENMDWREKLKPGFRRLGTVHFMGKGYWVWLIPLASGNTSVGIVADPNYHDFSELNKFDKAMEWLNINEPLCAEKLNPYRDALMDFRVLKHYAHDSGRFYSTDKWGVVGEAGAFLDPFYSPGTDFIALGNTWVTDLILRDFSGEDIASRSIIYERVHATFFQSWVPIYQNQYSLFGNTQVMVVKILWDWGVYWSIPTLLFTNNGFININILRALFTTRNSLGDRLGKLNIRVQKFFQDWASSENNTHINGYIDFFDIPFLKKMHIEMDIKHSEESLIAKCEENLKVLEEMAAEIFRTVSGRIKGTPEDMKINPYEFSFVMSNEELLINAQSEKAIDTRSSISSEMKIMWLEEKLMV
ncbi:MAG: FAD-dependent monooxygenase [Saprospiraceae bacterium]|nr:FAD-dependent monooxygenase [Saprospiraceae bacterium]